MRGSRGVLTAEHSARMISLIAFNTLTRTLSFIGEDIDLESGVVRYDVMCIAAVKTATGNDNFVPGGYQSANNGL